MTIKKLIQTQILLYIHVWVRKAPQSTECLLQSLLWPKLFCIHYFLGICKQQTVIKHFWRQLLRGQNVYQSSLIILSQSLEKCTLNVLTDRYIYCKGLCSYIYYFGLICSSPNVSNSQYVSQSFLYIQ